jgi:putative PIN family toxin of toxin-antitoxin system
MAGDNKSHRVLVDSNIFVSGLITARGNPFLLLEALRAGQFTLLISDAQRAELADVLSRPRLAERFGLTTEARDAILTLIDTIGLRVSPPSLSVNVRDPKDQVILASAVGGQAEYPVTGDDDLLVLDGAPALGSLRILTPREFLQILSQEQELGDGTAQLLRIPG